MKIKFVLSVSGEHHGGKFSRQKILQRQDKYIVDLDSINVETGYGQYEIPQGLDIWEGLQFSSVLVCTVQYRYCTSLQGRYSSSSFITYPGTYCKVAVKKTSDQPLGFQNELDPSLINGSGHKGSTSPDFFTPKSQNHVLKIFFILINDTQNFRFPKNLKV